MDWKDAFTPPFKHDGIFINDAKGRIAMNPLLSTVETRKIINKLNGKIGKKLPKGAYFSVQEGNPSNIVYTNDKVDKVPTLLVRGWGRLHGTGGFNLPVEEAAVVQNDFIQWIVKTLNS